jgi:hypothetical protein
MISQNTFGLSSVRTTPPPRILISMVRRASISCHPIRAIPNPPNMIKKSGNLYPRVPGELARIRL